MRALVPDSAVMEFSDGAGETLSRDEAVALYLANRATVPEKRLRVVGGRNEFERALQLKILRGLEAKEAPGRKRALLIGDSIRMRQADGTGYGLHAYRRLTDTFNLSHIPHNTENSGLVLNYIDDWLQCKPDVVHFNAGLHDLSTSPGTDVLPPWHHPAPRYQEHLRKIVDAIRRSGATTVIWASSTPVHDGWHNVDVRTGKTRGVLRTDDDVQRYNEAAADVMNQLGVPVNDLYSVVMKHGLERCLIADGVHLSADGARIVGEHVAEVVREQAGGG